MLFAEACLACSLAFYAPMRGADFASSEYAIAVSDTTEESNPYGQTTNKRLALAVGSTLLLAGTDYALMKLEDDMRKKANRTALVFRWGRIGLRVATIVGTAYVLQNNLRKAY